MPMRMTATRGVGRVGATSEGENISTTIAIVRLGLHLVPSRT